MNSFLRTKLLIGEENLNKLIGSHVMVFGVGGVGGYVVEALVRSGVSQITIVDNDTVSITNLNRQIIATSDVIGRLKVEVMKERILNINPNCVVNTYNLFIDEDNIDSLDYQSVTYIVDAVDTITAKIAIIKKAKELNIPIISSMGAGNRLDPTQIKISDINQTKNCPLAKVMRYELKKREISKVKCVYSLEIPTKPLEKIISEDSGKEVIASISYMPSIFGLMIASEIIKDTTNKTGN
jgi:tRNA A37 threonylcarbamoyladenosine dehydratase